MPSSNKPRLLYRQMVVTFPSKTPAPNSSLETYVRLVSYFVFATFLLLLFTTLASSCAADVLSPVPFFSRSISFAVDTALVPAPLSCPTFTFHIHHLTGSAPLRD